MTRRPPTTTLFPYTTLFRSASITTPSDGQTYVKNALVRSSFSCSDGAGGPGIKRCLDMNGNSSGAGIDTTTTGTHSFTVTAERNDGLTATKTVTYNVAANPT